MTEDGFAENGKNIDLLIGSNLNEWTTMMGGDQGTLTEEEVAAYESAYPDKNPENADKVDTLIRIPMLKIMSHKAMQGGSNIYAYVFTYEMVQTMEPVFIMAQKFPMYSITYKMIRKHRNLQTRSARHGLTLPKPEYHPQTECQSGKLMTTRRVQL